MKWTRKSEKTPESANGKKKISRLLATDLGGGRKIICIICKSQKEKLKLMPHTNMTFIDHIATDGYKWVVKEKNYEDAISTCSSTCPEKVTHEVPAYSAISSGFRKMAQKERKASIILYDITHYIAVKDTMKAYFCYHRMLLQTTTLSRLFNLFQNYYCVRLMSIL